MDSRKLPRKCLGRRSGKCVESLDARKKSFYSRERQIVHIRLGNSKCNTFGWPKQSVIERNCICMSYIPSAKIRDLKRELIEARKEGRVWFDWKKLGASTFSEYSTLMKYVFGKNKDPAILRDWGVIGLSTPVFKIVEDEDKKIPAKLRTPDPDKFRTSREMSVSGDLLGNLCFKFKGGWTTSDILGNFQEEIREALDEQHHPPENEPFHDLTPDRSYVSANQKLYHVKSAFRNKEMRKVQTILELAGVKTSEVYPRTCSSDYNPATRFTEMLEGDCVLGEGDGYQEDIENGKHQLLLVEVALPYADRLCTCTAWNYWKERGGEKPEGEQPDDEEMEMASVFMKRLLRVCLGCAMDEIVLWDGFTATAIKFDLIEKNCRREKASSGGTVGVVGYWAKSVPWNSADLPVISMLTALAWRQHKLFNDKEAFEAKRETVRKAVDKLWTTADEVIKVADSCRNFRNGDLGTAVGRHLRQFHIETIQDYGYKNRVFRISQREYRKMFPDMKCTDKTVILKVQDYHNLEQQSKFRSYYDCLFEIEVNCYKRIWEYNTKAENKKKARQPKIYAPKLYDYGFCCFRDSSYNVIIGDYLIMEDLGDGDETSQMNEETVLKLAAEQRELLHSIGVNMWCIEDRNRIVRNGKVYVYDFERAWYDRD